MSDLNSKNTFAFSSKQQMKTDVYYLIYNASGTILGELTYITKKIFKQTSCAACDITHSFSELGEKEEFKQCRVRLGVTLHCIHSNDMDDLLKANVPILPVLVRRDNNTVKTIFTKEDLDAFQGSVSQFETAFKKIIQSQ